MQCVCAQKSISIYFPQLALSPRKIQPFSRSPFRKSYLVRFLAKPVTFHNPQSSLGHGGDGFLKFQDSEEITNIELADAFEQMWSKRRYHEIFFMIDTCQAASMYQQFYSPNILAVASSLVGEDSLSHHIDTSIGVYIIDRYTYHALNFLERVTRDSK